MLDRQTHVINHEMSHLVMYLILGGKVEDLREMQVKPLSGYLRQISHDIAENYFARCCLALAGPVSDEMIGAIHSGTDIPNSKEYLRHGLAQNGFKNDELDKLVVHEYERAWHHTKRVLIINQDLIKRLRIEGYVNMNANKILTKTKVQAIAVLIKPYLKNFQQHLLESNFIRS